MTELETASAMQQYLKAEQRRKAEQILEAYRQIDDKNALERAIKVRNILDKENKRG